MTIDPPPSAWPERVATWIARRNDDRAARFRAELGLPTDRPIILTGHQPFAWHPGVLAKFIACDLGAHALGAAAAWIVPDQDETDPFALRIPTRDPQDRLHVRTLRFADPVPTGFPIAAHPAQVIEHQTVADAAADGVTVGVKRIGDALAAHARAASAARQGEAAVRDLLDGLVAPATAVFSTDLARAALFADLVDRMAADPAAAIIPYNEAVDALPQAGVGRLIVNEERDRYELPLWRIRPGEPRRRVYAHEVGETPREELAPRALFMTAIMRLAGCDLFIHGTGGAAYDAVTDRWIDEWLGEPLAPVAAVTATLLLPQRSEVPTPEAAAKTRWRAHHARHDPTILGDTDAAERKRRALEKIAALREGDEDPAPVFQAMQRDLRVYREANRDRLDELVREADRAERRLAERDIIEDRTWAFPLHKPQALQTLRSDIAAAFKGVRSVETNSAAG